MAAAPLRVLEGHLRTYRRTWKGTAVTTFLNPVLFLLALGMGLGTLVDRGPGGAVLAGDSYLAFLAPGLLAATAMQTAAVDSSWPVLAGMKWLKTYHAALATPVSPGDLALGHLAWLTLRLVLMAVVFAGIMVGFGVAAPARAAAAVPPAVLTGLAFGAPITAFAALLDNDHHLSSMFRFAIMPMFLFSGTFFPITELPGPLQAVAVATPLWHGVQLTRHAALDVATAWPLGLHVLFLAAVAAAGGVLAARSYRRRLVV